MKLRGKQKQYLKAQAHDLSPVFQIGKKGLTEEQMSEIRDVLEKRELIKISLLQNTAEDPKEVAKVLQEKLDATPVQIIGNVIVLFKKANKPANHRISLEVEKI